MTRATRATSKPKEATFPEASVGVRRDQPHLSTSVYLMNPGTACSYHFVFVSFFFVCLFGFFFFLFVIVVVVPWSLTMVPFEKTNLGSYEFFSF